MKSLIAVLALTLAVGAGYWKMQNPDGGLPEASLQANNVVSTALSRAKAGIDTIRSSGGEAQAALENEIDEKLSTQATETDSRLSQLQQASTDSASKMEQRLQALEEKLSTSTTDNQQLFSSLSSAISNKSDGVQQELETNNESTAQQLTEMQAKLDQLSTEQSDSITNSFDSFKASLQGEVDNLKAGDQNSRTALDSFTEKLASLDTRLDTLTSAAASSNASSTDDDTTGNTTLAPRLEAVTAQVDQRLAAMEERLAEATSADTRSTLDTLSADISDVKNDLARLDTVIEQNNGRTTQMVGSAQTDLAQVSSEIASLKSDIDALKSAMESSAIENTQNDLQQQLRSLETLVKSTPAGASSDITEISTALDKSRERILSLEERVTDLPASTESESAKELQEELQIQIAALEARLAKANATPDQRLVSSLSAVQQKVSDLENKNYLTTDDIDLLSETTSIQYKIYFDIGSTDISNDAGKVLDSMIAQEANRATNISIFGTTDRSGPDEYNQWLALRRANGVRSYLIQNGFDFTKIRDVDGIGEDLAASIQPDGANDPNQRSVIIFAFQP